MYGPESRTVISYVRQRIALICCQSLSFLYQLRQRVFTDVKLIGDSPDALPKYFACP
jgi:hypothetical protein